MPVWLAPVQAVVMNISEHQTDYARQVAAALEQAGLRAVADLRNEKISYKIREHSLQKLPYQVVVGDKEVAAQTGCRAHPQGRGPRPDDGRGFHFPFESRGSAAGARGVTSIDIGSCSHSSGKGSPDQRRDQRAGSPLDRGRR